MRTDNHSVLVMDSPRRFGYIANPARLRVTIPAQAVGVYMLLKSSAPFYVGRSDHCLLTRLCGHELLAEATHVVWEPCITVEQAFHMESAWFHILGAVSALSNQIHPARPADYYRNCPFCDTRDIVALEYALPHLRTQRIARPAVADQPGSNGENHRIGDAS